MADADERREYPLVIIFNKRRFTRVVVDSHYETNHPDITDQLILELVRLVDGSESDPVGENYEFKYFAETLTWQGKTYRIVLTYCEEDFLGVINAFRVKEMKL
jgi:hypothetical protein